MNITCLFKGITIWLKHKMRNANISQKAFIDEQRAT